jgi:hypothetical protein
MSATIMGVVFYQSSIPFYSAEREVFYREQAAGMYSVRPYAFGYFFAELPYLFLSTLIFVSIFYFMAGLDPQADKFFFYYLVRGAHAHSDWIHAGLTSCLADLLPVHKFYVFHRTRNDSPHAYRQTCTELWRGV